VAEKPDQVLRPSQVWEVAADRSVVLELDCWPADKAVLAGDKELDQAVIEVAVVDPAAAPVLVAGRVVPVVAVAVRHKRYQVAEGAEGKEQHMALCSEDRKARQRRQCLV